MGWDSLAHGSCMGLYQSIYLRFWSLGLGCLGFTFFIVMVVMLMDFTWVVFALFTKNVEDDRFLSFLFPDHTSEIDPNPTAHDHINFSIASLLLFDEWFVF